MEPEPGAYRDVNKPTVTPNVKFNDLNIRIQSRAAEYAWNTNQWQQLSCNILRNHAEILSQLGDNFIVKDDEIVQ